MNNIMKDQILRVFSDDPWDGGYWMSGKDGWGERKTFNKNGHIETRIFYKSGARDGECKIWYKNGQIETICYYKNGDKEGSFTSWYDNGQLYILCSYKNDYQDGEYKQWNADGTLERHGWAKHGHNVADFLEYPELKKEYDIK